MSAPAYQGRWYCCYKCHNQIALHDDIVSKSFQNTLGGPKKDRYLITGLHTVADVSCSDCGEVLGWRYEKASEVSQKYKEGKYVLEKFKIVKDNW